MKAAVKQGKARALALAKRAGVLRPRDLAGEGIPRSVLAALVHDGLLARVSRGLYVVSGADVTEHHTLAQAAVRFPDGVVCLLSALQFHDLTTQLPHQVWLAISRKARRPRESGLPVRFVRFSGQALAEGIEEHRLENVRVRVYGVAKTVADCFKFRNKIGLDVALEALRDSLRRRKATVDDLERASRVCRVAKVMGPYLEAML